MDTASTTAVYHRRQPPTSEIYNYGLSGARGRASIYVITCCYRKSKTKSGT